MVLYDYCPFTLLYSGPVFRGEVILLDLEVSNEVEYKRSKKTFHILKTTKVDLDSIDGARKIKAYLGIEDHDFELLDTYNLLVEGESDQKYLEELGKYYGISIPKIIAANGVNNFEKYLEFYSSFYNDREDKPYLLILVDNDNAGREVYKRIYKKSYKNIETKIELVPNFLGERPEHDKVDLCKDDHQIEDLIYPNIVCDLVNKVLVKKNLKQIKRGNVEKKILKPAFKSSGILSLLNNEKNNENPDNGHLISFVSSSYVSESFKKSLSNIFNIKGDRRLSNEILLEDVKYPEVKAFVTRVLEPRSYINNANNQVNI